MSEPLPQLLFVCIENSCHRASDALTRFERVATRVTGGVFALARVYLAMTHLLGVSLW